MSVIEKLGVTSGEATPRNVHGKGRELEIKSSGKLDDSRSSSRCRLAKQRAVDVVVWQAEVYGVEDIEEVGANRKASVLSYRESLDNGEVDLVERRSIELVTSNRALSSYCRAYGRAALRRAYVGTVCRARISEETSCRTSVRARIGCGR